MKILKYVGIAIGSLLALLLIGVGLIVALFDPNDYKDDLQKLVRDKTGRELSLAGDLKLSVYPWIALEFGPASLGNAAGFGSQPMLSVEHARLGIKLLPLLRRQVEVGSVEFTKPVVLLMVDAAGRDNWSDLGGSASEQPENDAGSQNLSATVASLTISEGDVTYDDRQADSRMRLSTLSLNTGKLAGGEPTDVSASFVFAQDESLSIATKLRATARMDFDGGIYQLDSPSIELLLRGEGMPKNGLEMALTAQQLIADLKQQTLRMPKLEIDALGAKLSGDISGRQIIDAPSFSGPISMANVSLRELLPKLEIDVPVTADPNVLKRFSFSGQLAATDSAVQVNQLKMVLDDSSITGSAGIADLDSTALRFDLDVDKLNADRYLEPAPAAPAGNAPAATVKADATPIEIPVEVLRDLNLRGNLAVSQAIFADMQYSRLRMGINARNGKMRLFPSEAQMYGGKYSGDITLDASLATPRASFDEHITGVDFALLFRDLFDTRKISGRGNVSVKAAASGKDSTAMLRTLNGNVAFHVDNGAFEGVDLWYEIRRARALLKKQAPPERSGPARTAFTALNATGTIVNGVVNTTDLNASTQYLRITGKGATDLVQGQLDYRVDTTVLKIPPEGAGAEMGDVVGFVIPVRINGALTDPKIRPDLEGLAKAAVKQKVEEKKQELIDKAKEQLGDKLKGIFGR